MNNIFNPKRFGRLFIKHSAEHYKSYLMALGVLVGVLTLGVGFFTYINDDEPLNINLQTGLFAIVLMLAGTMFTSNIFADIGDKKRGIAALTLPASHFEKYLVGWIYSFVIFQLIFLVCYPAIISTILSTRHWKAGYEVFNLFHQRGVYWIMLLYAFLHAATMCGAIFFNKLHFIKTAFIFFIGLMILMLINKQLVDVILGRDVTSAIPFGQVNFFEGRNFIDLSPASHIDAFFNCLTLSLAFILWAAAYFRLTEKQV